MFSSNPRNRRLNFTRLGALAVIVASVLAMTNTPAAASGQGRSTYHSTARSRSSNYPVNPYNRGSGDGASSSQRQTGQSQVRRGVYTGQRWPQQWFDREEYPQGPNGPRYVHIKLNNHDLRAVASRMADKGRAVDGQYRQAINNYDRAIRDYSQRLGSLEMSRHQSREHFVAHLDMRSYVSKLTQTRERLRQQQIAARNWFSGMGNYIARASQTTVVWNVRNHRNRGYVPASYLKEKAIKYLVDHHDRIGRTTRINF